MLQICENIRQARVDAGKTQQDVAEFLNIPRSTYAHWEANREPDFATLKQIASYFGVNVLKLVGEDLLLEDSERQIAAAILRTEAKADVLLSAVAELIAYQRNVLPEPILQGLRSSVEEVLKGKRPK